MSPGQKPQTWAFSYSGTVSFTGAPAFPVTVSIDDGARKPVTSLQVKDSAPFTISADLPAGSYSIDSNMNPASDKIYWVALGQRFFVDQKGLATFIPGNGPLLHQLKMTVLSPDPFGQETVTEARPVLEWKPLPGATGYSVYWIVEKPGGEIDRTKGGHVGDITTTEFQLPADLVPDSRYEWGVLAMGPPSPTGSALPLGYWSSAYFFSPGGKIAFQNEKRPAPAKSGAPFLGLVPVPMPIPPPLPAGSPASGIGVMGIMPDSPALKAGLMPQDVLISFNGQPLENASLPEFLNLVRQISVGTTVPIEFVRNGKRTRRA